MTNSKNLRKIIIKKKFLLKISLTILLSIPITLYLLKKETQDIDNWNSSDWSYRRSIVITNDHIEERKNEEILIEINTEELIEKNKLQNNCADLRFLDNDNLITLKYWIEGGCNTEKTQIWVNVNSLPKDGKIIYIYYGNSKAYKSEEDWGGSFFDVF